MQLAKILILGGYGNTGLPLARLLLENTGVEVVLAGRNGAKAAAAETRLNAQFPGNRVTSRQIDASIPDSLKVGFGGVDFVLVASGTARYSGEVARAALDCAIDYLDVQYSGEKLKALQVLKGDIEQAGRCFVTEAGYHPGLPAVLVRYIASYFDTLEKAVVSSVINMTGSDVPSLETAIEFVEEFKGYHPLVFKGGEWVEVNTNSTQEMLKIDFSPVYGSYYCAPMSLEEMRDLPRIIPTLKETGFYIGDTNILINLLVYPVLMAGLKLSGGRAVKALAKYLRFSYKAYKRPPYGVAIKVEASGQKDGKRLDITLLLSHEDGYIFTAIPVAAFLEQYLDGSSRKTGLWMMGHLADPARLFQDLLRMGVKVRLTTSQNLEVEPLAIGMRSPGYLG